MLAWKDVNSLDKFWDDDHVRIKTSYWVILLPIDMNPEEITEDMYFDSIAFVWPVATFTRQRFVAIKLFSNLFNSDGSVLFPKHFFNQCWKVFSGDQWKHLVYCFNAQKKTVSLMNLDTESAEDRFPISQKSLPDFDLSFTPQHMTFTKNGNCTCTVYKKNDWLYYLEAWNDRGINSYQPIDLTKDIIFDHNNQIVITVHRWIGEEWCILRLNDKNEIFIWGIEKKPISDVTMGSFSYFKKWFLWMKQAKRVHANDVK